MVGEQEFTGYVNQLTGGIYIPSIYGLLGIDLNYKFLLSQVDKNSKILEIGPGNGFFIDRLIMNGFENITCVDLDEINIQTLSEKYKNIKSIKCIADDGIKFLQNTNEKFNVIITRQVLEHLEPNLVKEYFAQAYKSLNKEGLLVTETINAQNICYGHFLRYDDSTHKNAFSEKSIVQYGGTKFQYTFNEFRNLGIFNVLNIFLNSHFRKLYDELIAKLNYHIGDSLYSEQKSSIIKKIRHHIRLGYYKSKSKRISRRYLKGYTVNSSVFTDMIITVSKKI